MRKLLITLIVLLILRNVSFSQYETDPKFLLNSSVFIENYDLKSGILGSGSGFYIDDSPHIYLATAAHVLFEMHSKKLLSSLLLITSFGSDAERDKPDSFVINLDSGYKAGLVKADFQSDVALIKIGMIAESKSNLFKFVTSLKGNNYTLQTWPIFRILDLKDTHLGNDLFIIGFPTSLNMSLKFNYQRPLLRKGILAGRSFEFNKLILDCPAYFGNSGGMVIGLINTPKGFQLNILGLVNEYIPFTDNLFDSRGTPRALNMENSGYSVAAPGDKIKELIKTFN